MWVVSNLSDCLQVFNDMAPDPHMIPKLNITAITYLLMHNNGRDGQLPRRLQN